ncbi:hypothetical protein LTR17_014226 [Elasticomyces elasticus]|nr:hypothetical protein LTR17_014226 [Elasticomyces elasticus]
MEIAGGVVGILSLGIQVCQGLTWYYGLAKDCPKDVAATLSSINSLRKTLDLFALVYADDGLHQDTKVRVEDSVRLCTEGVRALEDENKKFGPERLMSRFAYPFKASTLAKLKEAVGEVMGQLSLALQILDTCENSRYHRQTFARVEQARKEIEDIASKVDIVRDAIAAVQLEQDAIVKSLSSTHVRVEELVSGVDNLRIQQRQTAEQNSIHRQAQALHDALTRLQAVDPTVEHDAARLRHHPGTGQWFLDSKEYAAWKAGNITRLWVHGKSGCSKTVLCSTVIEDLQKYCVSHANCFLAYFYFTFSDHRKQSWEALLRTLIVQLATGRPVVESLRSAATKSYITLQDLEKILTEILEKMSVDRFRVYIIIDGLDECPGSLEGRPAVERGLARLANAYSNISVLVTSQSRPDIERFMRAWEVAEIAIPTDATNLDIESYVQYNLNNEADFEDVDTPSKILVATSLGGKADGMFRWAALQLDMLRNMLNKTPQRIKQALLNLPPDLGSTYEIILTKIPDDCWQQANRGLIWLSCCQDPLNLEQLAVAMCIDPGTSSVLVESERVTHKGVLEILAGLVILDSNITCFACGAKGLGRHYYCADENNVIHHFCKSCVTNGVQCGVSGHDLVERIISPYQGVRLAHSSVQDYLLSGISNDPRAHRYLVGKLRAECTLGRAALSYVDKFVGIADPLIRCPLLGLASGLWYGFRRGQACSVGDEEKHLELETSLFNDHLAHWWDLLGPETRKGLGMPNMNAFNNPQQRSFHIACAMGLDSVVRKMLQQGQDVNAHDVLNTSPLHYACLTGQAEVAATLLCHGANINARGRYSQTPLMTASESLQPAIVKLLLSATADVAARDTTGSTALHVVVQQFEYESVQFARGRDSDAELITELLIRHGVDVNSLVVQITHHDSWRFATPLELATWSGLDSIATRLREAGAVRMDDFSEEEKTRRRADLSQYASYKEFGMSERDRG